MACPPDPAQPTLEPQDWLHISKPRCRGPARPGAALTALALIGAWLYVLRLRAVQRAPGAAAGALLWQGMGRWRWVSLCLILLSLALTARLFLA